MTGTNVEQGEVPKYVLETSKKSMHREHPLSPLSLFLPRGQKATHFGLGLGIICLGSLLRASSMIGLCARLCDYGNLHKARRSYLREINLAGNGSSCSSKLISARRHDEETLCHLRLLAFYGF